MTEHDQAEVERVARSLSRCMADALKRAYENGYVWSIPMVDTSTSTFLALQRRGCLNSMWYVLPLGLAVRAHLMREQQGGQG